MEHDTYDRRIQLGASRRRREDGEILHQANRWAGAIYMGGYAVECALKALICHHEGKDNLKGTRGFSGISGNSGHNLTSLLSQLPSLQRAIALDRTNGYKPAWDTITTLWQKDHLRYWDKVGKQIDSEKFLRAITIIHRFLLSQQGEAS